MAQQSYRDPIITLRGYTDYTEWIRQLQAKCAVHNIWDKVNPKANVPLIAKPVAIRAPPIAEYTPAANTDIPTRHAQLSTTGQNAFEEDLEYYKCLVEKYKDDSQQFEKEQASLKHIAAFIRLTVSPHLLRTCCLPDNSIRQWITDLQLTVGFGEQIEQEQARERYLASLKPMRSALHWDTWLAEYDQAATDAETYRVAELSQLNVITKDFLVAVKEVAPIWSTIFQENGRFAPGMSRREMMKRYREYMVMNHPLGSGKHKAVSVSDGASYLAEGDATTQSTDRDASQAESALFNGNSGRSRLQHISGKNDSNLKRPSDREPASTGQATCPACGKCHGIRNCYYVNPEKAPEWWKPNEIINELINFRLMHDTTFQGLIRGHSGVQSRT